MMLQRAASHIRTRQSKWLQHNLKDIEEKVQDVLKLLEEEGDSFAKRAEMYYKRRPELISFVEEFYRAYHALAEKYDHVSTELQNANTTLASVFPGQVPSLAFEDDDDDGDIDAKPPRFNNKPTDISKSNIPIVPRSPNVREMEESFISLKDQDQINNLHMQITETCSNISHLSGKLPSLEINERVDDAVAAASLSEKDKHNPTAGFEGQEQTLNHQEGLEKTSNGIRSEDQDKEQNMDNQDILKKKFNGIESEDQVAITVQQDAENISRSSIPNATEDNLENRGVIQEEDTSHCEGPQSILEEPAGREDALLMKQLLLNKMEDREKILLKEYTTILRNFKEMKKTLNESEKKRKTDNTMKDDEIQSLQQKLSLLQENGDLIKPKFLENREQDGYEEHIQVKVDEQLEENLDFCLRFSTYFSQIQKFNASIHDLHIEISKLKNINKQDGGYTTRFALRSEVCPINKHLREIQMELTVWSEKGTLLKEEIKSRYLSLSSIEDELRNVLNKSSRDFDSTVTTYQAAKFQGEISNMKRENKMIAYQLKCGLDHINALQIEVEKFLVKLSKEFPHSRSTNLQQSANKPLVPLRSLICEAKPKKHSLSSFFSCIHPHV